MDGFYDGEGVYKVRYMPSFVEPTHTTRMIFPIMIHGNIAGIAAITGLPVMKNDVTGVIKYPLVLFAAIRIC